LISLPLFTTLFRRSNLTIHLNPFDISDNIPEIQQLAPRKKVSSKTIPFLFGDGFNFQNLVAVKLGSCGGFSPTRLKNMLVKLDHFPKLGWKKMLSTTT